MKKSKFIYPNYIFSSISSFTRNAYKNSKYYREVWEDILKNKALDGWDDFLRLSPTNREIFQTQNIAVDENRIAYYYFSGGTTGRPKVIPVTKDEWRSRNQYRADCYSLAGFTKFDSVWIALPFGPWAAGPSVQHAFHILGSNILPAGLPENSNIIRHIWNQVKRMNINVIATTPSILKFIERSIGEKKLLPIEKVITTGEYVSNNFKRYWKDKYNVDVIVSYGSSECFVGIECLYSCGYHYDPERIFIEVVDSKNNLPTNTEGSILLTNLKSEAIPLIRYRIGDHGKINHKNCRCGSSWPRLEWTGRDTDFYKISGGINFHTYQISEALSSLELKINKTEVIIQDGPDGKDFIYFTLYLDENVYRASNKKRLKKQMLRVIRNLSFDFNAVVLEGSVKMGVKIISTKDTQFCQKTQIKVNDLRKFKK